MRRIIDSHCHIYPDSIALKAVKSIDRFYDGLPCEHHDGTCSCLVRTGNASGITHFIVHSVATTPEQVSSINHFIARSVQESHGSMTGLGTMHQDSLDLKGDIREIIDLGLKGVKLHPDFQRFCADDPKAMNIYALCEEYGLPILIHTGDYRYDYSNPERIVNVLKAFPNLKMIGAHFGGWSVWDEAVEKLSPFPNFIVDTCSSLHWLKPERTREIIRLYGTDRVLFATDYPIWPQDKEIDYLLSLGFSSEDYERIFWKNTAELFCIHFDDDPV